MDLVGEILAKEPLVSRLVAAQALDVLEVEGGGLVFEKLVSLCGGSKCVYFYWSIVITVTVTIVAVHTSSVSGMLYCPSPVIGGVHPRNKSQRR